MASDNTCVFCGEKFGLFSSANIFCAGIYQPCCKNCAKELADLSEEEKCRRALRLGYAQRPEKLEERIELITKAEEHRPSCLRCGAKLQFEAVQCLDNSPMRDSIFTEGFEILPAYCPSCGKYEFYHPSSIRKNKFLAYLIEQDTGE